MKVNLIVVCALVALSFSLFTCSPKEVALEVSCDDFYQQRHIRQGLQISAGDSFTVTLCSNPTTGFRWSETASISDQTVLQQKDHQLMPPESEPPSPPGTPGQEIWTFEALKSGTSTVSLEYSRLWEGGEKGEWTFVLNVIVK